MFTTDEIQPQLHAGVEDAVNRAVSMARKWGNSARAENPGDRGLHWATYKVKSDSEEFCGKDWFLPKGLF